MSKIKVLFENIISLFKKYPVDIVSTNQEYR